MQHFLASRQGVDIPIKHLYVEYKFWIERTQPFGSVRDEVATLSRQGDDFRRIIEPKVDDPIHGLAVFLDAFDVRTAYPLLLTLLDRKVVEAQWNQISQTVESFLLRRAICGLTTKNYNRVFLQLARKIGRDGVPPEALDRLVADQVGESTEWPSDAAFAEAWRSKHAYHVLNNPKMVYVFKRLNATYLGDKMEDIPIRGPLSIEHVMPQIWVNNWPLKDGSKGKTSAELWNADESDLGAQETRRRNAALQTFGNLTILTQPLNSSISNGAWKDKRPELLRHSLLPINQYFLDRDIWDEDAISKRGDALLERALKIWPRPKPSGDDSTEPR